MWAKLSTCYHKNSNGRVSTRICKVAFLRMHCVSNGRLDRALKGQIQSGGTPHADQRGHHSPPNKTSDEDLKFVREHTNSVPKYQSHYSRADNHNRKYLSSDLNIGKMYMPYKEFCCSQSMSSVSEWMYRQVFNKEFNLSFGWYVNVYSKHTLS